MVGIVDLELKKLANRMRDKGYELVVSQQAKDFLIENGTDEKFGARPLRRAIEHHLEDALSEAMLRGEFEGRKKVSVTVQPSGVEGEKPTLKLEGIAEEASQPEPVGASST